MRRLPTFALVLTFVPSLGRAAEPGAVDYTRDVRPILANSCYACHGPDAAQRKAKLRLDRRDDAVKKAIVAGRAAESPLVDRITSTDAADVMPPPDSKKPRLTPAQVDLLRRWIDQGAKFDVHWAYVAPKRTPPPSADHPVDAFVRARLKAAGLDFAPEADRVTLIRRLSFDLLGLPPSPEQVDAFVADTGVDAYERLVDRLLASKHYGERMAISWLDQVRYADTGGYHSDNHRDVAPYRDYVIAAFNANKPFDRFTVEQLAGDLLPNPTLEQRIASGYNRLLQTTEEGGAQPKEYTAKYAADRVRNASAVWLAGTMGCAECHNHKFDPFTTHDFYRFAAFFADIQERAVGRQEQTPIPTGEPAARLAALDAGIARLKADLAKPGAEDVEATKKVLVEWETQRTNLLKTVPTTLVALAGPPRTMRVLPRGNWLDDSGEVVTPATPQFLTPLGVTGRRATRLDLARWLTAADNPLTSRVFVNRLWKIAFGQGLVRSMDDFGAQGSPPTHPELLDWLAVDFVESGWDVKRMLKRLVTARVYRQSSATSAALRERDPTNQLLARQTRYRLDAEMVRDNALAVSGLLARQVGGPSVKPYQPAGYWSFLNFPVRDWKADAGAEQYRRGLYTYWCRTFPHPSLLAFDAPSREECTVERPRSSTPLQALVLLNDPIYVEAARVFAERTVKAAGDDAARLTFAFRRAVSRSPRPEEAKLLLDLVRTHREEFRKDAAAAQRLIGVGQWPAAADVAPEELAAWTSAARVLLNLHESVTRP